MFITYLKENGFLCHDPNEIQIGQDRQLFCKICNRLILDVNKHLTVDTLPMLSSFLAKHYANWTGDLHVPCRIVIKDIPGIKSGYVEISYFHLLNAIELLGTVNQDFILCKNFNFDTKSTLKAKILENFIKYYMNMVDTIQHDSEDIETILKGLLKQMKDIFDTNDVSIFDYYFKVICPYVKTFDNTLREETINVDCPGEFFLHLSKNATDIRKHFSKYCLPFDIIYIMIYCFICHKNLDMVVNFVFDLIARLCNKYFDEPTFYQEACKRLLPTVVKYDKKNKIYYAIKDIQNGQASEVFSFDFYNKFAQLQQLLFAEFSKAVSTPSEVITKFAFSQSFPFFLFPNSANYYGFMCMMSYATSKLNTKKYVHFEKETCANARELFKFVESYAKRVENFANGLFLKVSEIKSILNSPKENEQFKADIQNVLANGGKDLHSMNNDEIVSIYPKVEFWTLDHFNLFVSKDEDIIKQLTKFMHLLLY